MSNPLQDALAQGEQFKAALQTEIDAKTKLSPAIAAVNQGPVMRPILPAADVYTPHGGIKE